jgi:hypothetical protein
MKIIQQHWYCIKTKQNREVDARTELINVGFDVYLPLKAKAFRSPRRSGGRKPARSFMVPAIRQLLFVKGPLNLTKLSSMHEIDDILCSDAIPYGFSDGYIDACRENERIGIEFDTDDKIKGENLSFLSLSVLDKAVKAVQG